MMFTSIFHHLVMLISYKAHQYPGEQEEERREKDVEISPTNMSKRYIEIKFYLFVKENIY